MAFTRPSGLPLVSTDEALVFQEVAQVDPRGRLNLIGRWTKRVSWIPTGLVEVEALLILREPGLLSICAWEPMGEQLIQRYQELAKNADDDSLEAVRLLQDRYQRLAIPKQRRIFLGEAALTHLGLTWRQQNAIYVAVYADRIDLLSSKAREDKLVKGHHLLDDLP